MDKKKEIQEKRPKKETISIKIYFSDTDAVGVVYHANYLDFAERARTELAHKTGLRFTSLAQEKRFFVLRAANIQYYAPARLEDLIDVTVWVFRMGTTSVDFIHEFINKETGVKIAEVMCTLVFVDMKGGSPVPLRVPSEFKEKLFE